MGILNKFTFRSLKLNKKRSLVTTIGIILSVALITAVAGMFASFQETLIRNEIKLSGKFHTTFRSVPKESLSIVRNHRGVESYFFIEPLGYANFNNRHERTPYLFVAAFNQNALENSGLRLIKGRLPENENEIIITTRVNRESNIEYQIGDVLNLELFDLERNPIFDYYGNVLDWNKEPTELFTREYRVVGISEIITNHMVDWFGEESVTVITYVNEPTDNINLFVYYHNPRDTDTINTALANELNLDLESQSVMTNRGLLRWQGVVGDNTLRMLYGIAGVIISIIILTSIFVIKNGFAISVIERTKDYGILASIGATKKQIRKSVLFEGFILGLVSIPIGIIAGLFAVYTLIFVVNTIIAEALFIVPMAYIIPYTAILISILLGVITIYLSCIFIAWKTSRISPIMNIRNNDDIKIKAKKLKTPKFIEKIFGVGGVLAYKNMKRNKKRYRTTVISMIISVITFITMSSFVNYTFREALNQYDNLSFNIFVGSGSDDAIVEIVPQIINLLEPNEDYWIVNAVGMRVPNRYVNLDHPFLYEGSEDQSIVVYSIGERGFRNFVQSLGLNYNLVRNQGIFVQRARSGEGYFNITDRVELTPFERAPFNLPIAAVTRENPIDARGFDFIIVSDEIFFQHSTHRIPPHILINANDPYNLEEEILALSNRISVSNHEETRSETARMMLIISIFLYGFITVIIVIGLTNIINTLSTSLNLRKKEFAMFKAIGVTNKEFRQIINLESVFLGIKVLMISIPIGMLASYAIYNFFAEHETTDLAYDPNLFAIIVSIIAVFLIVKIIMSFTLKQINKQSIIEVIRNDNI